MPKLQNKKLSLTYKFKIHDESIIIIDFLLGFLCLLYNDLIFNDIIISLVISLVFMFLLIVVDIKIVSKISVKQRKDKLVDEMLDLILIYRCTHSIEKAILIAFSKIYEPVYDEEQSINEKLDKIADYFSSIKYDIFYKACKTNPKYECLSNVRNKLEDKNDFVECYIKNNKEYKWAMTIFFFLELGLIYFHSFYSGALIKGEGIALHLIMCVIFVTLYYFSVYNLSKKSNEYQVEKFVNYFIAYACFEKPYLAFDDACVVSKKIGEELLTNKNLIVNNDSEDFYKFISKFTKDEIRYLLFVYECIKRNYLIKSIPDIKYKEDKTFDYILKIVIILPLIALISLFVIEVFYL